MSDTVVAFTDETRNQWYLDGLKVELDGAKARAGHDHDEAEQAKADQLVKDIEAEIKRVSGGSARSSSRSTAS